VENFRGWLHQVAKNHLPDATQNAKEPKNSVTSPLLMQNEDDVHLNGVMEKEEKFPKIGKMYRLPFR
jgi:RNA polymerase sigma-70 factor (ECF subfamily)